MYTQKDEVEEERQAKGKITNKICKCLVSVFTSFRPNSSPQGLRFLKQLHASQNLDLYEIASVKMIIQFFYEKYKTQVLIWRLPPYVIALVSFLFTLWFY